MLFKPEQMLRAAECRKTRLAREQVAVFSIDRLSSVVIPVTYHGDKQVVQIKLKSHDAAITTFQKNFRRAAQRCCADRIFQVLKMAGEKAVKSIILNELVVRATTSKDPSQIMKWIFLEDSRGAIILG